jgi:hypothetical protein
MRDTEKIFESVNDIKKILNNINSFISIYSNTDTGTENIKFLEKYKIFAERTGREIITDIKILLVRNLLANAESWLSHRN